MSPTEGPQKVFGVEPEMLDVAMSQGSSTPQLVRRVSRRPAAIVLGSTPGEPIRPDLAEATELTGSGVPIHPVAGVDEPRRTGRLPVAYAWMGLQIRDNPSWTWESPRGVPQRVAWQDAIAETCAHAFSTALGAETRSDPPVCVTIPNSLDLDAQDSVRRAVSRRCRNATLLWRPIAAAIEWLAKYERDLSTEGKGGLEKPIGRLLVVDLGLAGFEVTVVDLVPRDDRILAARRLPDLPILHGAGVGIADHLALRVARVRGLTHPTAAWTLVWCTDLLANVTTSAEVPGADRLDITSARQWLAQFGSSLTAGPGLRNDANAAGSLVTRLMPMGQFRRPYLAELPQSTTELRRWLDQLRLRLRKEAPFLGVAAVGVLSSAPCEQSLLGETIASIIAPSAVKQRVLTDRIGGCGSILAAGATRFENFRRAGMVPYLDSLPDIETLLQEAGEPVWAPLLKSRDRYVPGGRPWASNVSGSFAVRAEEQELRLTVAQEGEETVREVDFMFPRPVARETPVQLLVELTPGQGNPRVEVTPHARRIFAGRRFYLDWRRSKDTGKSKQQAAEEMERIFPPLEPRQGSRFCWWGVRDEIRHFQRRLPKARSVVTDLQQIRRLLRQKDEDVAARNPPDHATAIGSDGTLDAAATTFDSGRDQSLLSAFEERVIEWLDDPTATEIHPEVYRVVGYSSSASKELAARLSNLLSQPYFLRPHHLNAYANCLRNPKQIARFADVMVAKLTRTKPTGSNDWFRALARILQYRADATEQIRDGTCDVLLDLAHEAMKDQLRRYEAKYIYRHTSLCIAYLLRRRRYSASFLDPGSNRAEDLKVTLKWAARGLRSRRIDSVGGFVDLAAVTELIVDYIDRRGKGRIVLLSE